MSDTSSGEGTADHNEIDTPEVPDGTSAQPLRSPESIVPDRSFGEGTSDHNKFDTPEVTIHSSEQAPGSPESIVPDRPSEEMPELFMTNGVSYVSHVYRGRRVTFPIRSHEYDLLIEPMELERLGTMPSRRAVESIRRQWEAEASSPGAVTKYFSVSGVPTRMSPSISVTATVVLTIFCRSLSRSEAAT